MSAAGVAPDHDVGTPVNVLRRDQFLAELIAEFKPSTVVGRRNCEHLAGIYEQLEALKPGST